MIDKIGANQSADTKIERTETSGDSTRFDNLLGRVMESSAANQTTASQTMATPGRPIALAGVGLTAQPSPVDQTETVLGLMDQFAAALGDPEMTAKGLAPLAQSLDREADRLTEMSRNMPENDAARDLLNRTAVLAKVQAAKFERGEFN